MLHIGAVPVDKKPHSGLRFIFFRTSFIFAPHDLTCKLNCTVVFLAKTLKTFFNISNMCICQVDLARPFKFKFAEKTFPDDIVPIISANMDTIGTFEMAEALSQVRILIPRSHLSLRVLSINTGGVCEFV